MTQENTARRINRVTTELNVSLAMINEFLRKKNVITEDLGPNSRIEYDVYTILLEEFKAEKNIKQESQKIEIGAGKKEKISIVKEDIPVATVTPAKTEEKSKTVETKEKEIIPEEAVVATEETTETTEIEEVKEEEKKEAVQADKNATKEIEVIKPNVKPVKDVKVVSKIDITEKPKKKKEDAKKAKSPKKEEKKEDIKITTEIEKTEEIEDIVVPITQELTEQTEIVIEEKETISEPIIVVEPKIEDQDILSEEVIEQEPIIETEQKIKEEDKGPEKIETQYEVLKGTTVVGKIDLDAFKKPEKTETKPAEKKTPVASSHDNKNQKKKRRRIQQDDPKRKPVLDTKKPQKDKDRTVTEVSDEEIQRQVKETLARLTAAGTKSKASKYRRQKRDTVQQQMQADIEEQAKQKHILKVTEFLTANDLALMMNIHVNQVISTCLNLGLFVSINQRLDAEAITLVADEFGFDVEFMSMDGDDDMDEEFEEDTANLKSRHPVVTVMGHVDHGKTSLLDYIRSANVIAGEAGGITQHIGAYEVRLESNKKITFLDTPGHEAFTAMRARGAKLTDIAIIVIASDDKVMPQTIEAINHARAANVPMVFAINKMDKPSANPEKIKEELSQMNILVEDWGGKFQSQEISAKTGLNVDLLLEKVLLEAELLDLKANYDRSSVGTVIESSLEKGRGYVTKVLVQSGTLEVGDIVVAGCFHGKVKAMFNERNKPLALATPSTPVLLLGLDGAPQAGDKFVIVESEKDAKQMCAKRQQLIREQGLRTQKHITLDELGRRIAIGDFKELNIIVKGDVDGSIEALSDSLLRLSTKKIQVNIIHKSVGQITESDVLLASASDAIIVGFQVRPSINARKLAETEQIDIRTYSVIYDAIEEIKTAMEGMLSPTVVEKIVSNVEVRDVFKVSKVGTVAGCMVLDGKITRNTKVRIIRDGIVIYNGHLSSMKRFKDDVREVAAGYECGLSVENFNDIKVNDIIEGYEIIEQKAKL